MTFQYLYSFMRVCSAYLNLLNLHKTCCLLRTYTSLGPGGTRLLRFPRVCDGLAFTSVELNFCSHSSVLVVLGMIHGR